MTRYKSHINKIVNFYILPKLSKSEEIDRIISNNHKEYLHITREIKIDGRPIAAYYPNLKK